MKKKILTIMTGVVLAASLSACDTNKETTDNGITSLSLTGNKFESGTKLDLTGTNSNMKAKATGDDFVVSCPKGYVIPTVVGSNASGDKDLKYDSGTAGADGTYRILTVSLNASGDDWLGTTSQDRGNTGIVDDNEVQGVYNPSTLSPAGGEEYGAICVKQEEDKFWRVA